MKYFVLPLFVCLISLVQGQEFNAQVKVNTPKLQTNDPKIFRSLEEDIRKFINSRVWTNTKYQLHERIKCNYNLNIKAEDGNNFTADLTISASRPVFGSSYETTLINYVDKNIAFSYLPNEPINYVPNVFTDKLAAVFSFYSYLILGLDGDSFAPNGGDEYFLIAQNIVNIIPATISGEGWKPADSPPNRYWLFENIMSPRLRTLRGAWYEYHRKGLDLMHEQPVEARKAMAKSIEAIDLAKRSYPAAQWFTSIMDAKKTEIVEVFKGGEKPQQQSVYNMLSRIDPSSVSAFRPLQ